MSAISMGRLRHFNLFMAAFQFIEGIAILALSSSIKLPVTASYLGYSSVGHSMLPASRSLFGLGIAWVVAAIFFLSALSHLFIGTTYRKHYERQLKQGINYVRWLTYALCGSLIIVVVAMLIGISDLGTLILMAGLTSAMSAIGLLTEIHSARTEQPAWLAYILGCLTGLVPWLVLAYALRINAEQVGNPPAYVYFIFVSMLIGFSALAFNMLLNYRRYGRWKDYLYTEAAYMTVSTIVTGGLAWQIYAGILR